MANIEKDKNLYERERERERERGREREEERKRERKKERDRDIKPGASLMVADHRSGIPSPCCVYRCTDRWTKPPAQIDVPKNVYF